ncbi:MULTISPECIES: hypothetical protein [Tsukamurella]|uniref:YfhO family protein n=2 Tax=Tsukamurella TaxID=2060 RepID=A0A5C5RY03_9ACTN|nr:MULTISPECIES: hypothetical protein [Tsukamurella]NMD56721.1 hypothetical protein [Tsukamurella columbiensis]TWS27383.1 hypothetical protein FK530_18845 [Tsukamurella conjunctivitidis]
MRSRDLALAAWSAVLAALILGPLAVGGRYLLLRDAVSTPRSYLTDTALGLGDNAARATPQDWLIALGSQVVDGGLLVTALLFAALVAAGWGFGRCALAVLEAVGWTAGLGSGLAAATVGLWNPYVAERLLQGHWSLLAGYAAIGWAVVVGLRMRGGAQLGGFAACLAAGGLTPTGAVFALIAGLVAAPRRWAWQLGLFVCAAAPWLYPSLVSGSGVRADPASVAVFAARAEPGLGTLGSLLGLGGIWNRQAVPDGAPWLWTALALAVLVGGAAVLRARLFTPPLGRFALLALCAVVLPALAATGPGTTLLEAVVQAIPGSGLLRDGQKWVALAVPLLTTCAAALVAAAPAAARAATAVVAVALPIAVLPGLVWGVGGALAPVTYPAAWRIVAEAVPADRGAVAVLPPGMFRTYAYGPDAPVLDPAPRMLRAPVLQTGELRVGGRSVDRVPGAASDAEDALATGGEALAGRLAGLGVGWVLVEAVSDRGAIAFPTVPLPGLTLAIDTPELRLYRVPGDITTHATSRAERAGAWAAHALWGALLLGGGAVVVLRRRSSPGPGNAPAPVAGSTGP